MSGTRRVVMVTGAAGNLGRAVHGAALPVTGSS